MTTRYLSVFLLLTALGGTAAAEDDAAIVERAFASLARNAGKDWAYTETKVEDGKTWVGRWDPRVGAAPWRLLTVDGREPTPDESLAWAAEHGLPDAEDEDNDADIVTPGSLTLLEETDDEWLYGFAPTDDGDEEAARFMRDVDGRLRIKRDGPWLAELLLENRGTVRPATGVRISRFETRLTFGPAVPGGPIVPLTVDVHIKGRAYLAISFEERESIRYSAYEYAGSGDVEKMVPDR